MIYYPCPNCEQELLDLVSFENLLDQYGKQKILNCPQCDIEQKLDEIMKDSRNMAIKKLKRMLNERL